MPKYAGIGSRQTPADILTLMDAIGSRLAEKGWLLRSGGANGADLAFEQGCDKKSGTKEIFLPYKKFNKSTSPLFNVTPEAFAMAAPLHPVWESLTDNVRRFHARNCQQVLGQDLNDPVDLVICWTLSGGEYGGTAMAMKVAKENGIPIANLALETDIKDYILAIDKKYEKPSVESI